MRAMAALQAPAGCGAIVGAGVGAIVGAADTVSTSDCVGSTATIFPARPWLRPVQLQRLRLRERRLACRR